MANIDQAAENGFGEIRLWGVVDFISHTIENDTGVVPVAEDAVTEVVLGPFLEGKAVVVFVLPLGPAVEELIHHEEAHAVAEIEEIRSHRSVGRADGVDAEFAEGLEAAFPNSQRNGDSYGTAILMEADALELEVFPIEPETGVGLELRGADADGGADFIKHRFTGHDSGDEGMELGAFEAPELGLGDFELLGEIAVLAGGEGGDGIRGGKRFAIGTEQDGAEGDLAGFFRSIGDLGLDVHRGAGGGGFRSGDMDAPRRDMDGMRHDETDVSIDARTGIPAGGGLAGGVRLDGEEVFSTRVELAGDVVTKAEVAAGPVAEQLPIEPDVAVFHHAVEFDPDILALAAGRQGDLLAIPGDAGRKPSTGTGGGGVLVEIPLDAPVVRDVELSPGGGVESVLFGTGSIALEE